jgi:hypothetical protein
MLLKLKELELSIAHSNYALLWILVGIVFVLMIIGFLFKK